MRLRREQNKIAREFYKRLKENFDEKELHKLSSRNPDFKYGSCKFTFDEYDMWWPTLRNIRIENGATVYIHARGLTKFLIRNFILLKWKVKNKRQNRERRLMELEPSRLAIEDTFAQDTTEIFDTLNNN